MNLQSNSPEALVDGGQPAPARRGNGQVRHAQEDPDVIRMVSDEVDKRAAELNAMIAEAAYFHAQRRGFAAGHELEDWLAAEAEIAQRILQAESIEHTSGTDAS